MSPRLLVFIAASLDGYIATPDDKLDWLLAATGPDEDYGYEEFIATVDAMAMGRGTYDFVAREDPWPLAGRRVFVFTKDAPEPHDDVTFWSVPIEEAVARWDEMGLRRVYVDGGRLISSFLARGLIDEMTVTIAPRLLGRGRPLFHPHERETKLRLLGSRAFPSGMVTLRYERDPG
jgi:dihydrofolate reductase